MEDAGFCDNVDVCYCDGDCGVDDVGCLAGAFDMCIYNDSNRYGCDPRKSEAIDSCNCDGSSDTPCPTPSSDVCVREWCSMMDMCLQGDVCSIVDGCSVPDL